MRFQIDVTPMPTYFDDSQCAFELMLGVRIELSRFSVSFERSLEFTSLALMGSDGVIGELRQICER